MKKFLMLAILPLCAGVMLRAADPPYSNAINNNALMNGGCVFNRTQVNKIQGGQVTSSLVTTTNCPIKETKSAVGVIAPNGSFVPLGPPTNQQLITHVRRRRRYRTIVAQNKPIHVQVFPKPDGSVVVQPIK